MLPFTWAGPYQGTASAFPWWHGCPVEMTWKAHAGQLRPSQHGTRTMIQEHIYNLSMAFLGSKVHGAHVIHCKDLHTCPSFQQCLHTVHLHTDEMLTAKA